MTFDIDNSLCSSTCHHRLRTRTSIFAELFSRLTLTTDYYLLGPFSVLGHVHSLLLGYSVEGYSAAAIEKVTRLLSGRLLGRMASQHVLLGSPRPSTRQLFFYYYYSVIGEVLWKKKSSSKSWVQRLKVGFGALIKLSDNVRHRISLFSVAN